MKFKRYEQNVLFNIDKNESSTIQININFSEEIVNEILEPVRIKEIVFKNGETDVETIIYSFIDNVEFSFIDLLVNWSIEDDDTKENNSFKPNRIINSETEKTILIDYDRDVFIFDDKKLAVVHSIKSFNWIRNTYRKVIKFIKNLNLFG